MPNNLGYNYTDGGRLKADILESNDCSVRALAIALDIPYKLAHEYLNKVANRRNHMPMTNLQLAVLLCNHSIYFQSPVSRHITVNKFIKSHPTGIYLLVVLGHIFTVKNGTIYDTQPISKTKRIYNFAEVKIADYQSILSQELKG